VDINLNACWQKKKKKQVTTNNQISMTSRLRSADWTLKTLYKNLHLRISIASTLERHHNQTLQCHHKRPLKYNFMLMLKYDLVSLSIKLKQHRILNEPHQGNVAYFARLQLALAGTTEIKEQTVTTIETCEIRFENTALFDFLK